MTWSEEAIALASTASENDPGTGVGNSPTAVPDPLAGTDPSALARGRVRSARLRRPPRVPSWALKVVMAVTGSLFTLFLAAHLYGNLHVFSGPEEFNHYAHWLRTAGQPILPYEGLLWIIRVGLGLSMVAHVGTAVVLQLRARRSRGPRRRPLRGGSFSSWSGRTMLVSGIFIGCFVVFHIMDLTLGTPGAASGQFRAATPDEAFAYQNLVASFQRPAAAIFYVVALLTLSLHLAHGLWSVVNDLGGTGRRLRAIGVSLAGLVALVVLVGNAVIPIAVLLGVVS